MPFYIFLILLFYQHPSSGLSEREKYISFLKHEEKQKEFKNIQKIYLKKYLKKHRKLQEYKTRTEKQKLLKHEKKQKKYKIIRKKAFKKYKRQKQSYEQRKKAVLEEKLKQLQRSRKKQEKFHREIPTPFS